MGLTLGANVKGFDFSALLFGSFGNDIIRNYERQTPLANLMSYRIDRWSGPNSSNQPRLTTGGNRNGVLSDFFVEDGSFVRLKNIQLGYNIPLSVSERIGADRLRVYVAANNLFTLTEYRGFDPDIGSGSPLVSGIDYGFYPQARTYMVGLNLNF
jgi:hypothetical protein